jgi:hypothetical protein
LILARPAGPRGFAVIGRLGRHMFHLGVAIVAAS